MWTDLLLLHVLALWPIAACAPWVRRSNRAWRTHLAVLQATPVIPSPLQKGELEAAQRADAAARRKANTAVAIAMVLMVLQFIAIKLLWSAA